MTPDAPDSPAPEPPAAPQFIPRATRRETAARDALRALIRDHFLDRFSAAHQPAGPLSIQLRVSVAPQRAWDVTFDPPFDEQIDGQLADAQARKAVFRKGRVHCFRCSATDCDHSRPPGVAHVFRGYSPTGVPEWYEFLQALIDSKDEQMDRLYAEPPQVLARTQPGRALRYRQLSTFGRASRTYAILGQVIAGYFPFHRRPAVRGQTADRLALTLQAVETRDRDGRMRLTLNTIPGAVDENDFAEWLVSNAQAGLGEAIARASDALQALGDRAAAVRQESGMSALKPLMRQVPAILGQLARQIEQRARQGDRRTHHAAERRMERRPVHKALDDAREAKAGSVYFDERKHTYVVCGRQGRTHVFNAEGKHVTSFAVQPTEIDFRLRTRRWRPVEGDELRQFLARLSDGARDHTSD